MRLTKEVIQKLLDANEGFTRTRSYSGRNYRATYQYLIHEGKLLVNTAGKTSWADSRFNNTVVADMDQTRRFLRSVLDFLNVAGIE